ncbi:MAG: pyridoxamine 5'-phosphate oxidase family protein [Pseudomonadales bacterium]
MSTTEREGFLNDRHVGVLSIPAANRAPLTVPVWYAYEPGGDLWFLTGTTSLKGRRLSVGLPVSLCAQDEAPPYRYVSVEGVVHSIEPSRLEEELRPMARRYLGERGGDAYTEREGVADTITVRVRIERWLTVDYSKG